MVQRTKETLVIIPARGGSKGLPGKNILPLGGKPLIAHTIEAALQSRLVTRVVVSTEDEDIADVARAHGAEVPFLRPMELAGDASDLSLALSHVKDRLLAEGYAPWSVVHMYATSPFRPPGFVDFLISKLYDGYKSVSTVRPIPLGGPTYRFPTSVDPTPQVVQFHGAGCPRCFRHYGNISGSRTTAATRGAYLYLMHSPTMCIDIDTIDDFRLAELAWQRMSYREAGL